MSPDGPGRMLGGQKRVDGRAAKFGLVAVGVSQARQNLRRFGSRLRGDGRINPADPVRSREFLDYFTSSEREGYLLASREKDKKRNR